MPDQDVQQFNLVDKLSVTSETPRNIKKPVKGVFEHLRELQKSNSFKWPDVKLPFHDFSQSMYDTASPLSIENTNNLFDNNLETPLRLKKSSTSRLVKLNEITEKLQGVEKTVEAKTNCQLQSETNRLYLYKETLSDLETKIQNIMRERIETQKAMSNDFEQQLHNLHNKLELYCSEKSEDFNRNLKQLELKLQNFNLRLSNIENDNATNEIKKNVGICYQTIDEIKVKLTSKVEKMSTAFYEKITEIEKSLREKFDDEEVRRTKQLEQITDDAVFLQKEYEEKNKFFQSEVLSKINELRKNIENEKISREQADDDIVIALNQYTMALHDAIMRGSDENESKIKNF